MTHEIIAKISKGTKMDQIYIQKQRSGFTIGNYVKITPIYEKIEEKRKLHFYGLKEIEPIKLDIINKIIEIISTDVDNIIITGSFLETGFHFNDIDILLISEKKEETNNIERKIKEELGIKAHILILSSKSLLEGLSTDPLYQSMLSRCISQNKLIFNIERKLKYKILDLHLLKSNLLIENFDILNGNEKYDLIRNLIAIYLFLHGKKTSVNLINNGIKKEFNLDTEEIKQNMINKNKFAKKYRKIYNETLIKILDGVKNESKQK